MKVIFSNKYKIEEILFLPNLKGIEVNILFQLTTWYRAAKLALLSFCLTIMQKSVLPLSANVDIIKFK